MTALALLIRHRTLIAALVAVAVILALIAYTSRLASQRDALEVENRAMTTQLATMQRDAAAREQASVERVADTERTATAEKERADVIQAAAPGATGPASRALGCVRWKAAHPNTALPAACRP